MDPVGGWQPRGTGVLVASVLASLLAGCTGEVTGTPRPQGAAGAGGMGTGASGTGAAAGTSGMTPLDCGQHSATRAPLRRLTRFDYNNTVRDLWGVATRPADSLPGEEVGNGFGNDADALGVSPLLIDGYRSVAHQLAGKLTAPTTLLGFAGCVSDGPASDGGAHAIGGGVKVPAKGKVMTDLLVSALACGCTNVATMEWADSEAKFLLGFLNDPTGKPLADHHHGYQHDRGFQPGALKIIYNFYAQQLAHLLQSMDAIQEGNGRSLLDNSVILAVSEIQKPDTHDQKNMPFMLIGGGGGKLPGNRLLQLQAQPHNNLLLSLLGLFGGAETSFGNPQYCQGPIAGLV